MVDTLNVKMKVERKRKINKCVKIILAFLVIALMIIFFIYITIHFIKHPEKIPFLVG